MSGIPLVSVVIASYNMGQYVAAALRSALEQTYSNTEVIVVDDGSTDDTASVVEPFLADARVRYIVQPNAGQAKAKNRGINETKGDFVAFLDADDYWHTSKLDRQMTQFDRQASLGVAYSRVMYIDEHGRELRASDNALSRGRVSGPLLIANFIAFGSTVVRRECFKRMGCFDENLQMGIDYDLWLRFSTQYEFDFLDEPLLYYRIWPGQMSNNCKKRYLSAIGIMERFLDRFPTAVEAQTVNEAWAHTYVGFGDCSREIERSIRPALSLYVRALRYKTSYFPAWKAIIKTVSRIR